MVTGLSALLGRLFRSGRAAPVETGTAFDARVPAGQLIYAIGDIHGERVLLERLLHRLGQDMADQAAGRTVSVVFLGDYIDRGPDSRGVLDILCADPLPGAAALFLRGNHEQAMLDFLTVPAEAQEWLRFGGAETLASYGVLATAGTSDPVRLKSVADALATRLPPRHLAFLQQTELMLTIGDYVFVHAGIDPALPLDQQRPDDLLWIREGFIDQPPRGRHVVVHGHTIVDEPVLQGGRIAIDTGAYATGRLTAVALCDGERRILQATL